MLVLTRKAGETIVIGEGIEVTVLESKGDQIKLGIKAPRNVEIHRKEVFESIQNENKAALSSENFIWDFIGKEK
ncbi:carbon storage regulator CsrA [Bacillus testis]|uniref:carbon storage regulator CsrA n=1 Tax=Bacillus testis TaxID=1622072 RepID=UPI00067F5591|nr:carbon storage regulator CsrA [Bacillus testis]